MSLQELVRSRSRRAALTLIELVVVLVVLSVLAALIVPRLSGVQSQANSAAGASVIADVNRAASLFENRYGSAPTGNDGLLLSNSSSAFYDKLHPNLQTTISATSNPLLPILYPVTLNATQAASLKAAGITSAHYNDDSTGKNATGMPSDSGVNWGSVAEGKNVAGLYIPLNTGTTVAWTSHGSTFPDRAFNLNPFNAGKTDTFVVFGVGQPGSLRGATLIESPIVQSADPTKYYARVLLVYRIPGTGTTTSFPAQYVGAFGPDGTSINDNVRSFNNADKRL